jgi:hypothetical protein
VQYVAGSLDVRVFFDSDDVADAIARRSTAELFVRLGDAVRLLGCKVLPFGWSLDLWSRRARNDIWRTGLRSGSVAFLTRLAWTTVVLF